jgi:small GTP-binding protein
MAEGLETTTEKTAENPKKSGIITLIGRSNVGKSTLLNTVVGTKIAAVTDKPQTTRNVIHGVLNHPLGQAVFVDTPGVFKDHHNHLSAQMNESVHQAVKDIDVAVYVVDPTKSLGAEERSVLALVRQLSMPKILIINKSDLPTKEKEYLADYEALKEEFDATFELSALRNRHIKPLVDKIFVIGQVFFFFGWEVTFIDNQDFWHGQLANESQNRAFFGAKRFGRVNHVDGHVDVFDRLVDTFVHLSGKVVVVVFKDTWSVNKHRLTEGVVQNPMNNVTGGLRFVGDSGDFGPNDSIKEG